METNLASDTNTSFDFSLDLPDTYTEVKDTSSVETDVVTGGNSASEVQTPEVQSEVDTSISAPQEELLPSSSQEDISSEVDAITPSADQFVGEVSV